MRIFRVYLPGVWRRAPACRAPWRRRSAGWRHPPEELQPAGEPGPPQTLPPESEHEPTETHHETRALVTRPHACEHADRLTLRSRTVSCPDTWSVCRDWARRNSCMMSAGTQTRSTSDQTHTATMTHLNKSVYLSYYWVLQ